MKVLAPVPGMVPATFVAALAAAFASGLATPTPVAALQQEPPDTVHHAPETDPRARPVPHDSAAFAPDPEYDEAYDYESQRAIYGDKHLNPTQRPLLELGRDLYDKGPLQSPVNFLGRHNPGSPQLMVYGDFRTTGAYNDIGVAADAEALGLVSNRLTLDVDLRLTATERVHATFRPLDEAGRFTRFDLTGVDSTGFKDELDATPDALFFEGDLGPILGGLIGRDAPFDLPVAGGLMPLLFHNGIWLEDAFTGAAFTLPAKNSRSLDWSNFDITFFAGWDRVSNGLFAAADTVASPFLGEAKSHGRIVGTNWFIEAYEGYLEAGYAYVDDDDGPGNDFHSLALSFTKRFGASFSNSVRYLGTFGTAPESGVEPLADGHLLLVETSFITSRPYTFLPYLNLFASVDQPVSAARAPGAGGVLKNTGLNFETDGLTGFPKLADDARSSLGGALGLQMLGSDFGYQLVLEVAGIYPHSETNRPELDLPGEQYAFGARFQKPLTNALILRMDGMYGQRAELENISGARLELRYKF